MTDVLPKEKPEESKKLKKKKSIETLRKMKPFLERESFEYTRKDLAKKYEPAALSAIKEAASIVAEKHKTKAKNILGGIKHTLDYLRSPKDKKFLGHTDNKNK